MKIDPEYLAAVKEIYFWQYGYHPTNFTSQLLNLFGKADEYNKCRLALGFPTLYEAYLDWYFSDCQETFFHQYGITTGESKIQTCDPSSFA